jgi:glycosyltransferase involved in cell wall biosynthesis
MIKVLHVAESVKGGVPHFVRRLCEGLGPDFVSGIVCPPESDLSLRPPKGCKVHPVRIAHGMHPLRDLRSASSLRSVARAGGYDIVHYNSTKAGVLALILSNLMSAKTVFTPHALRSHAYAANNLMHRAASFVETRICRSVDVVVAISQDEGSRLDKRHNVQVIDNGVDLGALSTPPTLTRSAIGIPEEAYVVGMIARLSPQKDPETFVRAASLVADEIQNAHFVIAGDGPLEIQVGTLAADLGLAQRFHLLGWRNDAVEVLKVFDVFVSTSLYEGMSFSMLEAAGARKPIVAAEGLGVSSLIDHDVSGTLVGARDHRRLANALIALHRDEKLRSRLADGAFERIASPRSLDVMLAGWRLLYKSLLTAEATESTSESAPRQSAHFPESQPGHGIGS